MPVDITEDHIALYSSLCSTPAGMVQDVIGTRACNGARELYAIYSASQVDLSYNKLEGLAAIEPLSRLPTLATLHVAGNPLCATRPASYRDEVLALLPGVRLLDDVDAAQLSAMFWPPSGAHSTGARTARSLRLART